MNMEKTTMQNAFLRFKGESDAFLICGPAEPDGGLGLCFQGNADQLLAILKVINDQMHTTITRKMEEYEGQ